MANQSSSAHGNSQQGNEPKTLKIKMLKRPSSMVNLINQNSSSANLTEA